MRPSFRMNIALMILVIIVAAFIWNPAHADDPYTQPAINKTFSDIVIVPGVTTQLTVKVFNENPFGLVDIAYTDVMPPNIEIVNPAVVSNSCGGTVTAVPGTNTFSISGGSISAKTTSVPAECSLVLNVTSTVAGTHINTIHAGDLSARDADRALPVLHNEYPASATLQVLVVQPPSLSKIFNPTTIFVGEVSRLTITIRNNDLLNDLHETTFTDTLPAGVVLAPTVNPVLTGCGAGTVTAVSGTNTITLNNATVAKNSTCTVAVNVTSSTQSDTPYVNTIPAGPGSGAISTREGVTNATAASASLYLQNVGIAKSFSPTSIVAGATSTLTIRLRNPTGTAYTGASILDTLPAGLIIAPAGGSTTCGGGTIDYPDGADNTLGANERTIRLTGGTIPASPTPPTPYGTCTITVAVTTLPDAPAATLTNTIPPNSLTTDQGITNPSAVTANLAITRWLTGTKAFNPASIPTGGTSTVTITLRNNRTDVNGDLTDVTFTDTLPANVNVSGVPATPQCGGTVSYTATTVTLVGGSIPRNSSCTIVFQVTTSANGTYSNTIPAGDISTGQGASNVLITSNNLSSITGGGPVRVSKNFQTSPIAPGANVRLRISLTSPTDIGISGINFTDTLPAGMRITNSTPASNACGGTLTAITGTNQITLTNGAIADPDTACNIDVYVTADDSMSYTNTIPIGAITTAELRSNTRAASATLVVSGFTMSKKFYPDVVNPNGFSTLTITLVNSTTTPITNVTLTDSLSTMGGTPPTSGVYIADNPNPVVTCAGGVIDYPDGADNALGPNERTIRMTGGTIPPRVGTTDGACTISIDVQGRGAGATRTNTIPVANASGTISNTTVGPRAPATATLTIGSLSIDINKKFDPILVYGGAASTLSVTISNPNSSPLTGITFTDFLPAGMIIATPADLNPGPLCGPNAKLTGVSGSDSFTFSDGELPPSRSCVMSLRVTMNVNGNLTNTIPAGAVTTFNGVTNPNPIQATLSNLAGASISKGFSPNPVLAGNDNYSTLTITITNTSGLDLTGMGLVDTLPGTPPAGLVIAGAPAPAPSTTCSLGTLTAVPGTQHIELSGATLLRNSSCFVTIPVTSETPGNYENLILAGTLISDQNITNPDPATAALLVISTTASPTTGTVGETITAGDSINLSGANNPTGSVTFTLYSDEQCTIPVPGMSGSGVIANGAASWSNTWTPTAPGIYNWVASYPGDANNNAFTTKCGDVNEQIEITAIHPSIEVTKTPKAQTVVSGEDVSFTLTVTNTGDVPLSDVTLTDLACDTLTGPVGDENSNNILETTETWVYACTVNNVTGAFTNTVSVTGTPPVGEIVTDDDEADVTVSILTDLTKNLVADSLWTTINPKATVGEIVTYAVTLSIPAGGLMSDMTLTDELDHGLAFVDCESIIPETDTVTTDITGDSSSDFSQVCNNPVVTGIGSDPSDAGRQIVFNFGTVANSDNVARLITIRYRVVLLDIASVVQGVNLSNGVRWDWTGGSLTTNNPTLEVVEPHLALNKSANVAMAMPGSSITFRLEVTYVGDGSPAYDALLMDKVPNGITYEPGSFRFLSGQAPVLDDSSAPTLKATWATFQNTGVPTILEFKGTLANLPSGTTVTNTAYLSWSSLPGDVTDPQSPYNDYSVERNYDPGSPVNVYGVSSSATITVMRKTLPSSGFAPGRVTVLPSQPAQAAYNSLGNLWLEIPKLNVQIPILGIPAKETTWDLTWLSNQAGYLEGTAFPGAVGNSVLTAHVYKADGSSGPFVNLGNLRWGDQVILHNQGQRYIYEVRSNQMILPGDTSILRHEKYSWLTLFTCKGYSETRGDYLYRVAVRAVLVRVEAE